MPRPPSYRRQPSTTGADRAFAEFGGRRVYFGEYGTPASKEAYRRALAEWAAGGSLETDTGDGITVGELAVLYFKHCKRTYQKNGKPTSEVGIRRSMLRIMRRLYKSVPASAFGPKKLKAVRAAMIEKGWTRNTINGMCSRLRQCFKWAIAEELISPSVLQGLQAVAGLRRGHCDAVEGKGRKPVRAAHVKAVLPLLPAPVAALVRLQWYTGARAGELVGIRATEINRKGKVWLYTPASHKTEHHGHARSIAFGPKAQRVLQPYLESRPIGEPLFSPVESERARYARCKTHRRENQKPNETATTRAVGDSYTTCSYRRCIARACKKVGVPVWSPHQLRHSAITRIKQRFGMEAARAFAGHQVHAMTAHYSREADKMKARSVARKVG
ncbi:MAG: site-specific integrase [Planctomycetes bacterium]|nr:site-specific integrase [Planctomycetota bacterium]